MPFCVNSNLIVSVQSFIAAKRSAVSLNTQVKFHKSF